ncbi:MAG: cell division protein FtsA [Deltaproteobacteria bacterium]|nr:cell division protein FtsA [Deltaproteobacteria bacterium]MDZ4347517.1 cell division protein FtsA [Candidatus Binatia bacterium]
MGKNNNVVVGLDIGTSKVCAVVGEMTEQGIEVIGVGTHASQGLRKGVVVNIESTVASVKKAVEEAELMAGCEIHTVFVGIAGGHIKGFNSHGIVAVKNKEVSQRDVDRVIDAAKAVAIPLDREVLHILPQEYIIDDQDGIREPLGMSGVRLEARVHIVTGAVTSAQNIVKSCNRADLNVADIVLEPLASAEAVLTDEERELGVALIDMGGGTTDLVIFHEGAVKHTAVIAIGGNHVTSDIAAGLRTPFADAERIKHRYGFAKASMASGDERVEVPSIGGKAPGSVSRQILCEIIEPRLDELFELVQKEIAKTGFDGTLVSGAVMTGGSMLLSGAVEMAEGIFRMPTRLGVPMHVGGLVDIIASPVYATGIGLLLHGMKRQERTFFRMHDERIFSKVKHRMSDWLSEFF